LRCGGIFHYTFTAKSDGERIYKMSTFGEIMGKSKVSCLLTQGVEDLHNHT